MNITQLPHDIHSLIYDNLDYGKDMLNFKNTCKTFKKYTLQENTINVSLFEMKYKFIFNNCDINKHSIVCKKMSQIFDNFNLYKIHFNRTHNSCKSIFDTQTVIYVSMITDNINENKNKLKGLVDKSGLTNYYISLSIVIYFTEGIIDYIINKFNKNNNDIIINNISLEKINFKEELNETDYLNLINDQKNRLDKYYYNYTLDNDKLFINKSELIYFLIQKIKNEEKMIDEGIRLMDNSNDNYLIENKMKDLDKNVENINKYKKILARLQENIDKCMKDKVKKNLEATFMMID